MLLVNNVTKSVCQINKTYDLPDFYFISINPSTIVFYIQPRCNKIIIFKKFSSIDMVLI